MIRYKHALDIQGKLKDIARRLVMEHIDHDKVVCVRSTGSKSRRVIARCHALSRVMKFALGTETHYVIEVVSENFDSLSEEDQTKTIIHEMMHIPKSFGGGFRFHDVVNRSSVDQMYRRYKQAG
ncbi:MAG: putative metallopeptidase [Candidatus Aenigmatarchaeota archaeon]